MPLIGHYCRFTSYHPEYKDIARWPAQKNILVKPLSGTPDKYFCIVKLPGEFITTGEFSMNELEQI